VRVRVVGGADDDGVEPGLIEAFAPVDVGLGAGEFLQRIGEARLVDVAERDDVLAGEARLVREAAAPDTDEGDVEFLGRRILAEKRGVLEQEQARAGGGGGLEEVAAVQVHDGGSAASMGGATARRQRSGCRAAAFGN
jgi:hypothetical protein